MKKLSLFISLIILILAACSPAGEETIPSQNVEPAPTEASSELATGADEVREADELPPAPPEEPTQAPAAPEAPDEPPAEPTATEPEPTAEPQPTATAEPQFNGEYEGTFYRGLATAPITMIDYSDFL